MMLARVTLLFVLLSAARDGESLPQKSSKDPSPLAIIRRSEWGAKQPNGALASLKQNPPTYVVIHHAASANCTTRSVCQARIRAFQNYHMNNRKWLDIGYNFIVGEDGNVYEGRGWGITGAHAVKYNNKSVGICVIGNFEEIAPNELALNAVKNLITHGVNLGKISENYTLIGHRQASSTLCPGKYLYQIIQTWPHWQEEKTLG